MVAVPSSRPDAWSAADRLELLQWHLDRYDRQRLSTTGRASVVLSAGAVLSAGNAVVLTELLGGPGPIPPWLLAVFTLAIAVSAALVVLSLIRASDVLVTLKPSRKLLAPQGDLPLSLLFNGTDTVEHVATFADFRAVVAAQTEQDAIDAAQVELWIGIQQHRYRYGRLRSSVRLLRYAGASFLAILAVAMVYTLVTRL